MLTNYLPVDRVVSCGHLKSYIFSLWSSYGDAMSKSILDDRLVTKTARLIKIAFIWKENQKDNFRYVFVNLHALVVNA